LISENAEHALVDFEELAGRIAGRRFTRTVVLASSALRGASRETSLKLLEMTSGKTAALPETYLGLRHGPMSFLREDSLVLCFISSSAETRRYELDLLSELRAKGLGYIVAITDVNWGDVPADVRVRALAPELPDSMRTPFEIIFPQLLGLHLSLTAGLDPDNPSPNGVINRVVQGVRVYD
jgi:tagatose-6-phosphate ketose/aldose isomerase